MEVIFVLALISAPGWIPIVMLSKWFALVLAAAGIVGITGLATTIAGGRPWWRND